MMSRACLASVHPAADPHARCRGPATRLLGLAFLLGVAPWRVDAASARDATATALDRCLADPAHGSTAGQTDCEAAALRGYDGRMNAAFAALMRRLPPAAAQQLRRSQRAWLTYRDAEMTARQGIYAARQGTMYVPMEADDAVTLVGDRARLLERYVHALAIE